MKALEWLIFLREKKYLPQSKDLGPPSNGELRRWITDGAIIYNGDVLLLTTEITYPIQQLIFFPKGKRRTTVWDTLRSEFAPKEDCSTTNGGGSDDSTEGGN